MTLTEHQADQLMRLQGKILAEITKRSRETTTLI